MAYTGHARNKENLNAKSLGFMINHVFLPPCLPQQDDADPQDLFATVQTLCESVSSFRTLQRTSRTSVQPALEMLERFLETYPHPGIDATTKTQVLHSIITNLKNGDVALFHLPAQNAGLLLTARQDGILFEAFELLAPNYHVMACEGALLREFPGRAAVVALDKIRDDDFLGVLVDFIQKLEANVNPASRPKVSKGGTEQPEERDTVSPILATGLLIDILNGMGRSVEPDQITKRSREHVAWDNAFLPFHRSSAWLLLRVALRLVLDRRAGLTGEESWYKPLMAYHHARILQIAAAATNPPIPSDKLFSMQAKLARRITKLNPTEEAAWLVEVKETVVFSDTILRERWKRVQDEDTKILPLDEVPSLSFHQDSGLKLENLRKHLSWIKSRSSSDSDPKGPGDTTHFTSLRTSGSPALSSNVPEDVIMDPTQLLDFEAWVASELPGWTRRQLGLCALNAVPNYVVSAVGTLRDLIDAYFERARAAYEGIPEALSVMYLVIMELWMALDEIAGDAIPLLLDYDPGFPLDAFCPLLLEGKEEMARLSHLEAYLSGRQDRAPKPYSSAFEGFGRENSFAVQFFKTSAKHQRLRDEIESWGSTMKAEKLREYDTMKAEYDRLAKSHSSANCETYWDHRRRYTVHPDWCSRCSLKKEMDSLRISVFEWPLPTNSNHVDAVVVEISMPRLVQMWRDTTWKLVTLVFQRDGERKWRGGESLYFAGNHCGLPHFSRSGSRLRPASTVKPMEVTHYREKHISGATLQNVCVPHAADYEYYDEPSGLLAIDEIRDVGIPPHCSYAELVEGIPGVEDWIRHAKHTSNDVIAGQYRCPLDTTLEEFRAFGNLRSGFTLQWANILSQLVMPSLDFNKKPTFALVMQACLEAGPNNCCSEDAGSIWREAHVDTQKESFIKSMLQALDDALERVSESWQNDIALCLLACLATRLLSLSPSPRASNALLGYLARVRTASIAWARLLLDKLNHSNIDLERQEWAQRLLMAALISAVTFNVEEVHLTSVLSNPQDLALFVESALLARNHLPASGRPSDPVALQLVHRWHHVMYQVRDIATEEIVHKGNGGLDAAIRQFWAAYSPPFAKWTQPGLEARDHILERSNGVLSVSFNLLTGNLFVNGYPLSKLPLDYQRHPTFCQLFGEQILDVGPSSIPGMQFSACREQSGWLVHFAMKGDQLVVRAVRPTDQSGAAAPDNDQTWEYIPKGQLERDLPSSFVNNYAHWLNLSTDEIEFRPIDNKWRTSSENWRLVCLSGSNVLKKGSRFVIDPFSPTAGLAHKILGSIESFWHIDAIFDRGSKVLLLELPRLCLSFSVGEGEAVVKSKNYTGMQIDQSQGVGTLIGLSDKLVLKPDSGPGFRMILVPRGEVSARHVESLDHVNVSIRRDDNRHVRHDSFVINDKLGCLSDSGSLQSKLYLCWLHALTSHSLPDPLTSRTGTEESLRILRSAAVKSHLTIDHGSREFLAQIAELSPWRRYYPTHLCVMEQTTWNYDIPPLSQHDDFWRLAKDTYDYYERLKKLFQLDAGNKDTTSAADVFAEPGKRRSPALAERARIRNAIFRTSEFGAESHTTAKDEWYRPDDRRNPGSADDRARVVQLARCVDTGCGRLLFNRSDDLPERVISVNGDEFSGSNTVDLAFNLEYLEPPSKSLKGRWCGLHRELAAERNKYRKILFLSSLLYAEGSDPEIVQALMALGTIPVFSQTEMLPPSETKFNLTVRRHNLSNILTTIVEEGAKSYGECPEADWTGECWGNLDDIETRQRLKWRSRSNNMIERFVTDLESQLWSWTVDAPTNPCYSTYLHVDSLMPKVRAQVELARRSEEFHSYLLSLSRELGQLRRMNKCGIALPSTYGTNRPSSRPSFISARSLFSQPAPNLDRPRPQLFSTLCAELQGSEEQHQRLAALVDQLWSVDGLQGHQAAYLEELRSSIESPAAPKRLMTVPKDDPTIRRALDQNLRCLREEYKVISHFLELTLKGTSIAHQICTCAGTSPRISPIFLLRRLSKPLWATLSTEWRHCLVNLALTLIYLQRAERLAEHGRNLPERWSDLQRELSNPGDHDNPDWDPLEHPESLLLEIEQGIMIRPVQNEIAAKMRSPPGGENSVMQLNMGEGKSSVIVPIVAAALADGARLVRVVVAKPQASQMTHMLISRLGALINRRVFYLPISRSVWLSKGDVKTIRGIIDECKREGGVLLVQPEHLLSFKLMCIDRSWTGEDAAMNPLGRKIFQLYRELELASRDIVDESDENFNVKFELIYTIGTQEAVEMSPDRWILIQELLDLTATVVRKLVAAEAPVVGMSGGLLFEDRGAGRVPVIRVLEDAAGRRLVTTLATEVCRLGLRGLPVHHQTAQMRRAVLNYILFDDVAEEDIGRVEKADIFSTPITRSTLLLLRGLLAKGVLLFALGPKRFRVNYGLAPDRQPPTKLAVPYRAKDMPSLRSEFSHPDVVIVLTCLSYYYRGLADAELYTCLDLLNNLEQADEEYGRWAAACPDLPPSFRHFSSINVKDRAQCEGTIFPKLRFAKPVADFYLARVVFRKEMKQFPFKLSASGWDLAKPKAQPLTGFSGTNDSKGVLPLSVKALDLQPQTNATVLSTLLLDENTVLELGHGGGPQVSALTEDMLLGALEKSEPAMQVVLDVGAQIIESSNFQMAKKLLQSASTPCRDTKAVIFFNDQDELSVLTRNGIVESFLTSRYSTHTDGCLVFLDQAHTRGTDLKLPDHYRAAVTLGPGVTKDILVQACMRMRKLGQGQSVTFIVSPEMQRRIRGICKITDGRPLVVQDILACAISETWDEAGRSVPLWATQGKRHLRQEEVWKDVERAGGFSPATLKSYLEPEAMSLDQRYRPTPAADRDTELAEGMAGMSLATQLSPRVATQHSSQLAAIEAKLAAFKDSTRTALSSTLQEEQERELAPEIEEERHVSRPLPRRALPHRVHPELKRFIFTGDIPPQSAFFLRPFAALSDTSAAPLFRPPLSSFPSDLLVTRDFAHTVDATGPGYCSDAYQRGVQWVVTVTTREPDGGGGGGGRVANMVIVSPPEASWIKHMLDDDTDEPPTFPATLHAYLPRSSLAFRSLDDLGTYAVPRVPAGWTAPRELVMQLNLFAGQLYLPNYGEYVALCRYLGLAHAENGGEEAVAQDGFVGRRGYAECEFEVSPVAFLGELYKRIRRDCVGIEKTHMGRILAGEILTERDF